MMKNLYYRLRALPSDIFGRIARAIFMKALSSWFIKEQLIEEIGWALRYDVATALSSYRNSVAIKDAVLDTLDDVDYTLLADDIMTHLVDNPDFTYLVDRAEKNKKYHLDEDGFPKIEIQPPYQDYY